MKKNILLLCMMLSGIMTIHAQSDKKLSFSGYIATGLAMSTPEKTPLTFNVLAHYDLSKRLTAGLGTGLAIYEKALIPLYADVSYKLTKPHKFTPFVECSSGYSFATEKNTRGGFYFDSGIGMEWAVLKRHRVFFAVSYDLQKFERLKTFENQYIRTEFQESLSHSSIMLKTGITF